MSSKSIVLLWIYCNFSNFQNGCCRHLKFFKIEKFYWLLGLRGSRCISMPNFVQIGQSAAAILRFFDLKRWRRPPSWIVELTKFYWLSVSGWSICITVPNFVKISRSFVEILQFFKFSRWRPPPSWIIEITKFYWIFSSRQCSCISMSNFVKIGQSVAKILRFFDFFKMAAVRHLGFVWGIFGPPAVSIWGSLSFCKIWL